MEGPRRRGVSPAPEATLLADASAAQRLDRVCPENVTWSVSAHFVLLVDLSVCCSTATLHPTLKKYFFCVTAPSTHPWVNTGPFDTYILEAPTLTGPFSLVTYMPRFGMQAYFVSLPSAWMGVLVDGDDATTEHGTDEHDAVLTFSANFACHIEGCAPNILNAGYGANLLPVRFLNE